MKFWPIGTSIALWSDVRRLRYRESVRQENLVKLGETVRCDFNPGLFIARRMAKRKPLKTGGQRAQLHLL